MRGSISYKQPSTKRGEAQRDISAEDDSGAAGTVFAWWNLFRGGRGNAFDGSWCYEICISANMPRITCSSAVSSA